MISVSRVAYCLATTVLLMNDASYSQTTATQQPATLSAPPAAAPPSAPPPAPPVARREEKVLELQGEKRIDPYFWLRNKGSAEVTAYLEAENAYTDAMLKPTEKLQATLYQEMVGHIKEADLSVPYKKGRYFYYSRTEKGKQYPILCRRKVLLLGGLKSMAPDPYYPAGLQPGQAGPEEITLDVNELAKGQSFMALDAYLVSDDGNLLAYSTDSTGFRQYRLVVKDLRSNLILPFEAEKVGSVAWASDDKTLFYTVEDDTKRQYRLYKHVLGQEGSELLYEEKDERFSVEVYRSRSKSYVFCSSSSLTTSEVRYLPASSPDGTWKVIAPREPEHEYDVDQRGDLFYIRTNSGGRGFRLVTAPVVSPGREGWKEIVPHRPAVTIESVDVFASHLVLRERENALQRLRVMDLKSGESVRIDVPEPVYSVFGDANPEFDTKVYRYGYQSFVTPKSIFDYDVATKTSKLLKEVEVPGYDRALYASERLEVTAPDGVRVPVSIVYRKGLKKDGTAPLLLYGYGAYGVSSSVTFNSSRLSLLDRGFVYAIAHVRGGGDKGKPWHDEGRMMKKKSTFTDFIAVAEGLLAQKITSRDRLVIEGGSAGGLLMGAVTNMRPDLFAVVISRVPFVDVLSTMSDPMLPLTVGEFEEWGNPASKAEYDYMKSYCPYTNLHVGEYPAMLVKTSLNDSQVMYWEPAKYVARLRTLKTDRNPLLLKTNLAAGHGGASGRYDALRETAFDYAFILSRMGINR